MAKHVSYSSEQQAGYKKLFQCPDNWSVESAHLAFNEVRDGTHDSPQKIANGVPLITSKNLKNGDIDFNTVSYISQSDHVEISKRSKVEEGDILFSMIGTIGNTCLVKGETDFSIKNVALFRASPSLIYPNFGYYWLSSSPYQKYLESKQKGANQKFISLGGLRDSPIILPPLNEQTRIANKLDSLLAKVDAAQARLDKIPTLLKRFRQSVLAAATSGELTREWREQQPAHSDYLSEIEEFDSSIVDKKSNELAFRPIETKDKTTSIPASWNWVRLCRISEVVSGLAKGSKTKKEVVELPYLRVANVQRGFLNLDEVKIITIPKDRVEKLLLKSGDILFNEGGDLDKLGRGWIWEGQVDTCVHQNHVFRARLYNPNFNPKYISYYGNSTARDYFIRSGSQTVNLANLNKTSLGLLPVPLPSADEQKEIVRRVESLFTLADTVEKQYQDAKQRIDRLTQSILVKAFRGELVPQDPNDEPASELLKRIQTEREAQKPVKKTRKKKTKTTEQAELPLTS